MASIPTDIGTLAKEIGSFEVRTPADVRQLTEMTRVFCVEAAEVLGYAEYEIHEAVRWIDRGATRRAKQVTRPMKHAVSLELLAARRCVAVYRTFCKIFAEQMAAKRASGGPKRKFDWKA